MLIRHADPAADAAACAAIYAPYINDTVISLEEVPPTPEQMGRRIARITERYPWLVAEDDGEIAGYAYAGPHRERAAYRWASDVTVYLSPAYFRRGIGSALYTALFAGVTLPNEASVGLHESMGFLPVGVYRRVAWKFGSWHDVGWWQLQLVEPSVDAPEELGPPAQLGR